MGIIETIKLITKEEGREEGLKRGQYEFVKNLLLNTDFDIAKIASLASVTESFVLQVKQDIGLS